MNAIRAGRDTFLPWLLAWILFGLLAQPGYAQRAVLDTVLAEVEQEMRDDPRVETYHRFAGLLLSKNRRARAMEVLKEGREKFPDAPVLTHALAFVLGQIGKHEVAFAMFGEALEGYGGPDSDAANASFYHGYGAAAERAGHRDRAEEFLQKAMALEPESDAAPANYLGYMWADRGERLDEAEQLIRRALKQEPGSAAYMDSLGWVYFKRGDFDQALPQLLKAAAASESPDSEILEHLGDTYLALRRPAEALDSYLKAQEVELGNENRERKIRELQAKMAPAKTQ